MKANHRASGVACTDQNLLEQVMKWKVFFLNCGWCVHSQIKTSVNKESSTIDQVITLTFNKFSPSIATPTPTPYHESKLNKLQQGWKGQVSSA